MVEMNETACAALIPGYGTCGKQPDHVVHMMSGLSPREHLYTRPKKGSMETAYLTPDTIHRIAHRSGRRIEDLTVMLAAAEVKGQNLEVSYEVVNDSEPEETPDEDEEKEETDGQEGPEADGDRILPTV